ncbi:Detected protein of confused Function [Hibiscus syriacus]|uniref:non-specific serine/threonine protein kinase n=1 Tax=Hibiscus syriacus TaxID=106335 RepID=A0A6A3BQX9_HIBSY|nr:Detected protein of confused Function [Hibiscus syriacus]
MYQTRLGGCDNGVKSQLEYVKTDPSGRYGSFREILGKGDMKTVYRAFDEALGMEVAWNQVKLNDVFRSPDELQRLYSEENFQLHHRDVHFRHTSRVTTSDFTINWHRQRYQRVDMRAVKSWARQILHGLAYLHGHDPPVIHRDLKCDNIFVNGHLGQVKIGDLGLAPFFVAHNMPIRVLESSSNLQESDFSEILQLWKVARGILLNPRPGSPGFIGKCLKNVSKRLPAHELLLDPFLASNEETLQSSQESGARTKLVRLGTSIFPSTYRMTRGLMLPWGWIEAPLKFPISTALSTTKTITKTESAILSMPPPKQNILLRIVSLLNVFSNDDASSSCSMNSFLHCSTNYEVEFDLTLHQWRSCHFNGHRKLTKIHSLVDIRNKLLHQSVMAEINKRRLFNINGAVENIGYQARHISKTA